MDNINKIRNIRINNHRDPKKNKNFRYNDSLGKYKKAISHKSHKHKLNPKEKFEIALTNLREGLEEITSEEKEREKQQKILINERKAKNIRNNNMINARRLKNYNTLNNRISLSVPKYRHRNVRIETPSRHNYLHKKKSSFIEPPSSMHSTYVKTMNYSVNPKYYRTRNDSLFSRTAYRNFSRPRYKNNIDSVIINTNSNYNDNIDYLTLTNRKISDDLKSKELSNINNILQRQNKELRQNIREMRYKVNDLLNNIKLLRMDNQRLNSENNKLLMRITNLENEFDISKNMSMNELELKSNQISQLNEEVMRLNIILEEKENEIINLQNRNGHGINELDDYNEEESNNMSGVNKINELLKQIEDLKYEIEILRKEKMANGQNNKLINDKINQNANYTNNTLIQENAKIKKLCNNLKNDNEKMKKYISDIQSQKASFEEQQNEYQININDLTQKLNNLEEENNTLKNVINNSNFQNNISLNSTESKNRNNENEKIINKLLEENNGLKIQLEHYKNYNNNNSNNNNNGYEDMNINFLKNDIEEKNNEIKDLNEKIKNLMNDLSKSKNKNSDLYKQNIKLNANLDQVNLQMTNLVKENLNNKQKIRELDNQNNILKIRVNSVKSESFDFNKREQQNELMKEKTQLIKESNGLKNKILNLNNQIKELENQNHSNVIQICKIGELERQLKEAKNECEINFNELKKKQEENQKLINIINNKQNENPNPQNEKGGRGEISQSYPGKGYMNIEELKKNNEKLKKEIEGYKNVNNKLVQENAQLKERLQLLLQNEQDDGLLITLDNLKEELKDKGLQIEKLIKENNSLRSNIKNAKIINDEDEKELDLNNNSNKNENNQLRKSINSAGLNDAEKIKFYKEQIKELKVTNDSDQIQIKALKEDIKDLKAKLKNMQTFSGQLKDFNEFLTLLNQALANYKPKKKEQKDALTKIIQVMNNFNIY